MKKETPVQRFVGAIPKTVSFAPSESDMLAIQTLIGTGKAKNQSDAIRKSVAMAAGREALQDQKRSPDTIIPSRGYNFTTILEQSESISLVFNDMFGWLGNHNHREVLQSRMRANKQVTNIYLIHPESPVVGYIALKSNKHFALAKTGENRQVYDIKRALCLLLDGVLDQIGSKTKIIGHQWVHAYTMVMNEHEAYVTPYLNKRVGNYGIIHVYRAGKESETNFMYQDLLGDLEDMDRYSTDIRSKDLIKYAREHPQEMDPALYAD